MFSDIGSSIDVMCCKSAIRSCLLNRIETVVSYHTFIWNHIQTYPSGAKLGRFESETPTTGVYARKHLSRRCRFKVSYDSDMSQGNKQQNCLVDVEKRA